MTASYDTASTFEDAVQKHSGTPASWELRASFLSWLTSKYTSGRNKTWLKAKCVHQQEFVVGGFALPGDGGNGIGALLLGYYQDGKVDVCGTDRNGFYARHAKDSQKASRRTAAAQSRPLES